MSLQVFLGLIKSWRLTTVSKGSERENGEEDVEPLGGRGDGWSQVMCVRMNVWLLHILEHRGRTGLRGGQRTVRQESKMEPRFLA